VENELGIQNNKLNKHLSFHVENVQLLYDSNHLSQEKLRRKAATACACSHGVAFALNNLSQTVLVSACRAITFMSALEV